MHLGIKNINDAKNIFKMSESTFLKIKELLVKKKIEYKHLVHEHVRTSVEAAQIRGTNLEDAAKALIIKTESKDKIYDLIQAVIPADKRIDLKKLKNFLQMKNLSLASPEEVLERTGCTVGSVPPFGILFGLKVYVDESLLTKEQIVFSAGTHNDSIIMKPQDYLEIVNPVVTEFKKE
jgi:Ala-tRNA(Pro) deacylase